MAFWRSSFVAGVTALFADGTVSAPAIAFASTPGTGFYNVAAGEMRWASAGQFRFNFTNTKIHVTNSQGPSIMSENATATNPSLIPNRSDETTGLGAQAIGNMSLISGGLEAVRIVDDTTTTQALFGTGTASLPAMSFIGRTNLGFYESGAVLYLSVGGSASWAWTGASLIGVNASGPSLLNTATSSTVPNVIPLRTDSDSGMGSAGADAPCIIAGGVTAMTFTENTGVLVTHQVNAGLTADAGSIQGGTPLTSSFNVIATCATAGDSVTLPTAVAGHKVTIYNATATSADVFPASGDNLGAGLNLAAALAGGANITYLAYDDTNWFAVT